MCILPIQEEEGYMIILKYIHFKYRVRFNPSEMVHSHHPFHLSGDSHLETLWHL